MPQPPMPEPRDAPTLGEALTVAVPPDANARSRPDGSGESDGAQRPARVNLSPADLHAAQFSERYEMRRVLGAGGMGEARLYRDQRIGRDVAVKFLHERVSATASGMERFVREARVQGQLEHPAMVPVYDLGVGPDGAAYFSMKRVRGSTLEELVDRLADGDRETKTRYSRSKLLNAFANVCLSVDFAHARGVLHRDLKPANIMLGDFGEVHVLDWGVAKIVGTPDLEASDGPVGSSGAPGSSVDTPTLAGSIVGTPGYMAPEQARGLVDQLDARADVYALGAILYELLALAPLHDAPTATERLVSTLEGPDPYPSHRSPRQDVPPELDAICSRALALDASKRYASARALGEAVERFLDGDRDLERRRVLAAEHLEQASAALTRAQRTTGAEAYVAHREASGEVMRAVALEPGNVKAVSFLADLLAQVPDYLPPEAERELEESSRGAQRGAAVMVIGRAVAIVALAVMLSTFGVRDFAMVSTIVGGLVASSVANALWWRVGNGRANHAFVRLSVVFSVVGIGAISYAFGPFVMVPVLAMLNSLLFGVQTNFRMRGLLLATGPLTVLVPVALDALGVTAPAWTYHHDSIVIAARMIDFSSPLVPWFLTLVSVALTIGPVFLIGKLRESLASAERKSFLQAWQLRELAR